MSNRSTASRRRLALPRIAPVAGACALAMVALCAVFPGRAHATSSSRLRSIARSRAIPTPPPSRNDQLGHRVLEADISTPITVSVYFQATPEDVEYELFTNSSTQFWASYYDYYNALKAIDTAPGATSAQQTAFASLGAAPSQNSGNPVNGFDSNGQAMVLTSANLRALGLPAPPLINKLPMDNFTTRSSILIRR